MKTETVRQSFWLVAAIIISAGGAAAQPLTTLRSFEGADGQAPQGELLPVGNVFYGTTFSGGVSNSGTLFRINQDGTGHTLLKEFWGISGANPRGRLVLSGEVLFGTTANGGNSNAGTVYQMNMDGSGYAVLRHFSGANGDEPYAGLSLFNDVLYGTTRFGGISNYGTIFALGTNGSGFTVLKEFVGADGRDPRAEVTVDGTGLYGTTYLGGASNLGSVFMMNVDGTGHTVLRSFEATGPRNPYAPLLLTNGVLYGTATGIIGTNTGSVFKLATNGSDFTVLKYFTTTESRNPQAGLILSGDVLYGTTFFGPTSSPGAVFQISREGTNYARLHTFTGGDGRNPFAPVTLLNGALYGTTVSGGVSNLGALYRLTLSPVFTNQPQNNTNLPGTLVSFSVGVSGARPLTLQWRFNGTPIPGAIYETNHIYNVAITDAGQYDIVASNSFGCVTSSVATLTVLSPPQIVAQTSGATVACLGGSTNLSVQVSGTTPLHFAWYENSSPVGNPPPSGLGLLIVPDGTNNLTVLGSPTASLFYTCVISNAYGSVTSAPISVVVSDLTPPVIVSAPTNQAILSGPTCQVTIPDFTAGLVATDCSAYLVRQSPLPGSQPLTLSWLQGQTVTLTATDGVGNATNHQFRVNVVNQTAPNIFTQPQGVTTNAGSPVSLVAAITTCPASAGAYYWWYRNGSLVSSGLSGGGPPPTREAATYFIRSLSAGDVGNYVVVLSNQYSPSSLVVTSAVATVAILKSNSTVAVTGATNFIYTGASIGPNTGSVTGSGGAVTFSYTGAGGTAYGPSATPPVGVGSYTATATVAADDYYHGATSSPFGFSIVRDVAISIGATVQAYNGGQKSVTVTTSPPDLPVQVTYNGSVNPPSAPGNYTVQAVVNQPGYVGSASATLVIYMPDSLGSTVIKSFGILTNITGRNPQSPLVQGADGTLYGTTPNADGDVRGTIYKVQPDGTGFTVLKWFTNSLDGGYPYAGLTVSGNVLYGTTSSGGSGGAGTVFTLKTDGTGFTVLNNFNYSAGGYPVAGLILSDGVLYGTTESGGSSGRGTVFKVNTNGTGYTVLKHFSNLTATNASGIYTNADGVYPRSTLVMSGGTLYGTAQSGGESGYGTVFSVGTNGTGFAVLKHFSGSDGRNPYAGVTLSGNVLYGTTYQGGSNNYGTVFQINSDGTGFAVLTNLNYSATGAYPAAGLILSDGVLYGTTLYGGSSGYGTVFKLGTNGAGYTVLKSLTVSDGRYPYAELMLSGGVLYGTTQQGGNTDAGTVFKVNTNGTGHTVLKSFGYSEALNPQAEVVLSGGVLYGTTYSGGSNGFGTVFKVNVDGTGYTQLRDFSGTDGRNPAGGLTLFGSTLYGTAQQGGSAGSGTVFAMNTNGTGFTVLKNLSYSSDGAYPQTTLLLADGMLYGTTANGGSSGRGTVFKVNTNGTGYTVLKHFSNLTVTNAFGVYTNGDGVYPRSTLVISGGTLFGTAQGGGEGGYGTTFALSTNGTAFTALKHFANVGSEGRNPSAGLAMAGGVLYGITESGGNFGSGTVFAMNTNGASYTVLRHLNYSSDGYYPLAELTLSGGALYGTTRYGGVFGNGTAFRLNADGSGFTVLRHFTGGDGRNPEAGLIISGSTLYGTTYYGGHLGAGVVYRLDFGPVITQQPVSRTNAFGTPVEFAAGVGGLPAPALQWRFNNTPIPDATNLTFAIPAVNFADAGAYDLVATNIHGSVTSSVAALTVIKALTTVEVTGLSVYEYTGSPTGPIATSVAGSGGAVTLVYAGTGSTVYGPSANLSSELGTYTATASVVGDDNHYAASSNPFAFRIARLATVALDNLHQHFDGFPKSVSVATVPLGLEVLVTYNGSPVPPTAVGSYEVLATIDDAEYAGTATDTLAICDPSFPGFAVLKSFGNLTNFTGRYPQSDLVQGLDGTLYGTIRNDDGEVRGLVFKVQPDGSGFAVLKWFTNNLEGANPYGGLTFSDGVLYGTTASGGSAGSGTVFKMNTDGTGYTVLKNLSYSSDGASPYAGLMLSDGVLYGTAQSGGSSGRGTVFKLNTNGTGFSVLKHFSSAIYNSGIYTNSDGINPRSVLALSGGVLYGTAQSGGLSGYGTVFAVNTDGSGFTVLKQFSGTDGQYPYAGMTVSGGVLYGTASQGGSSGVGTLFTLNTDGSGFTVLKQFSGTDGQYPYAGLTVSGGALYGTTQSGGTSGYGTVFRINADGSGYSVLKNFNSNDGYYPQAGLVVSGGVLYGTTYYGGSSGYGTVFKVNTDGTSFAVIKQFLANNNNDERNPYANVTLSGSTVYGTTQSGGSSGLGTVFKLNTDGTGYTVLKSFNSTDAYTPSAGVAVFEGVLYGTTVNGGSFGNGTVFKMNTNGTDYSVLKSFTGTDGRNPFAGLTISSGVLYGTTYQGGVSNYGTVFKLNTDGTGFSVLKSFTGTNGQYPYAGLTLSGGMLYGTTHQGGASNYGTVFKLSTAGPGFSVLKSFNSTDGRYPYAGLALSGGVLYGATRDGGSSGAGTVFRINPDGSGFSILKHFNYSQGDDPYAAPAVSGGLLYGTTRQGGSFGYGTAYQMNTNGTGFAVLKNFTGTDGRYPQAGLALLGCTLYGTTYNGGEVGYGVVFGMNLAPAISSQPQSVTASVGTNVSFGISASGGAPLFYQWFKDNAPISGANSTNRSIGSVQLADAGNYWVVVTNNFGAVTSSVATLTVPTLPSISSQPSPVTIGCGAAPASFSVTASGAAPLTYQWYLSGTLISGATASNYMVNPATPANAGGYTVVITNVHGAVTSSVALLTLTNQTPTVIAGDAFSLSPGGTLLISPSTLTVNDVSGSCAGTPTTLTFQSFSPTSANGGTLVSLPPGIPLWTNRYNGPGSIDDIGYAVAVDAAGNVYVTGDSYANDTSHDYATIKYSPLGEPLWTNRFNGTANEADRAYALAVDDAGNVIVTGRSGNGGGANDIATVGYSAAGDPLWTNRLANSTSGGTAIAAKGNVMVTGTSGANYATVAYSPAGAPLWTNRYNGPANSTDEPQALAVGQDGTVVVTGRSRGSGSEEDFATLAYSSAGARLWTNRYNGPGNSYDYGNAVAVDEAGNAFVTGYSFSGLSYDYATVAYSSAGVPLWTNGFDGPVGGVDRAFAVAVDSGGNVYVAGYSEGAGTADDFAVVAYSGAGVPLWTNRYNGPGSSYDSAEALTVDRSGNILVTGHSFGLGGNYDYATVAYSGMGVPLWTNRYAGPTDGTDQGAALAVDVDGNVFVTGNSANGAWRDYATIAYSGNRIAYTPTNGFSGVDTFSYLMQDGYGLTYTGTVSVAVGVVANTISTAVLPSGEVQLGFYGTPGQPYVLERIYDLTSGAWSPQQTNTAAANGSLSFINLPVGSANFWRIRSVP